jgi:hypothetical protein
MTMSNVQPPAPPGPQGLPGSLAPPVPSAGDVKRAWRRLCLISLAVALVMLVAGGASGYLLASDARKTSYRASCGNRSYCIPSLKVASVIDALKGRGFTCAEKASDWECRLRIGDTRYESNIAHKDGLIYRFDNSVNTERREVADSTKAFLVWFAAMPFSNDPVLAEEIDGWLMPRLSGGTDTRVTIGGYFYSLTAVHKQSLSLNVWVGTR